MKQIIIVMHIITLCAGIYAAEDKETPQKGTTTSSQEILFRQKIAELLAQKDWQWLDFEEKSGVKIEVSRPGYNSNTNFIVNIVTVVAFKVSPDIALPAMGVTLPAGWKMTEWPLETSAEFSVPRADVDKLPAFMHAVFLKCFKCNPDYTVTSTPGKP